MVGDVVGVLAWAVAGVGAVDVVGGGEGCIGEDNIARNDLLSINRSAGGDIYAKRVWL